MHPSCFGASSRCAGFLCFCARPGGQNRLPRSVSATAQPNGWMDSWVDFWVERRLKHMIRLSEQNGGVFQNVDKVVEKVGNPYIGYALEEREKRGGGRSWWTYAFMDVCGCVFAASPQAPVDTLPCEIAFGVIRRTPSLCLAALLPSASALPSPPPPSDEIYLVQARGAAEPGTRRPLGWQPGVRRTRKRPGTPHDVLLFCCCCCCYCCCTVVSVSGEVPLGVACHAWIPSVKTCTGNFGGLGSAVYGGPMLSIGQIDTSA